MALLPVSSPSSTVKWLSGALGPALNTIHSFVAVTHPKNNYSSRTPCSSLLPLLNTHTVASGKQGTFTRKPSGHSKPSEGKAANPKMVSGLANTADACHQTVPTNKQVSHSGPRSALGRGVGGRSRGTLQLVAHSAKKETSIDFQRKKMKQLEAS